MTAAMLQLDYHIIILPLFKHWQHDTRHTYVYIVLGQLLDHAQMHPIDAFLSLGLLHTNHKNTGWTHIAIIRHILISQIRNILYFKRPYL